MKEQWYENDWFLSFVADLSLFMAAVANYYIHGGHISW
jgi:hypothetical protein